MRAEFSLATKKAALKRSGGICECGCDQPFGKHPKERPNYDHVLPCALGGDNSLENCEVVRWCCHVVKTRTYDTPKITKAIRGEKRRNGLLRPKRKISYRRFNDDPVWK